MFIDRSEALSPSVRRAMLTLVAKRSRNSSRRQFLRSKVHALRVEHDPPDGGRETLLLAATNMALLTEVQPTEFCGNSRVRKLQVPLLITPDRDWAKLILLTRLPSCFMICPS
jgi:hypothetical protein